MINPNQASLASTTQLVADLEIQDELSQVKILNSNNIIPSEYKSTMQAIKNLKVRASEQPLATHKQTDSVETPLDVRLFDARANVKIMTSGVSMHMEPDLRKKLFRQIDLLHDPDEWESDDTPINESSFKSFLSGFLQINPERGPGLGLSHAGNLIASWVSDRDSLIIEFMPNNVRWVITRFIEDEPEYFTGHTKITRLFESLSPFDPGYWFSKKEEADVHT